MSSETTDTARSVSASDGEEAPVRLAIIGSGPAGLTAAIYAARSGLRPVVISGAYPHLPGGQLTTTSEIHNFPGFPGGIGGRELIERMRAQAEEAGAEFAEDSATSIAASDRLFRILLEDSGEEILAEAVILATGAHPRSLGAEGEETYRSRGVSYCATCDGALYRKKRVAVVGGGDTALEEASYLAGLADSVTVVHRRDEFRASAALVQRARSLPNVHFAMNAAVRSMAGDGKRLKALILEDTRTHEMREIAVDGAFVAVGTSPESDLVRGMADLDEKGCVIASPETCMTSVPGLFAAGDVADPICRQAIVAAASGARAAMAAFRFLQSQR